ncbi:methyltransferase, TIGR04325 family [Marilutibacter alkalisoli]|nr:methyltransferase, TIGR04325 family [Lysobacter alkalisoli]
MELPLLSLLARPLYRRYFRRPYRHGNIYLGVYDQYEEALAAARALTSERLPPTYDVEAAGGLYLSQLRRLRTCDYAALFWLEQAIAGGTRRVFDLGGHIGLAYYAFDRYLGLPDDLDWCVLDVPQVMEAGRHHAREHDPKQRLRFATGPADADGCDFLLSTGALQYLDYSLPDLLAGLASPPAHVLFNLSPMHPQRSFFTLQNLGIAICPYRVMGIAELTARMQALGYEVRDRWELPERHVRIPFAPEYAIDRYYGFYFQRVPAGARKAERPAGRGVQGDCHEGDAQRLSTGT